MPRPDPAVLTTCDRLAARLPHLSTLQLAQVAVDLVNGVDQAREDAIEDGVDQRDVIDELNALRAAHGAAQQRIADLELRGLAGTKLGPYVLVPADLLRKLADSIAYDEDGLLTELAALVYTDQD